MPKRIIQDIILKKKVRKIEDRKREVYKKPKKKNLLKLGFWLLVVLAIFFLIGVILNRFGSIDVVIASREEFIDIDSKLRAVRNGGNNDLNFEIMSLEHSMKQNVPSVGTETIEKKASGKIVIYNTYSSKPINLMEKTRFETPDAKIYIIRERITVPGAPGSIEVTVYADQPGEEYNIGLTDFSIPGFKGDPKYEKVYARSKTEMSGGFIGEVLIASEEDIKNTRNSLRESIEDYFKEIMFKQKLEDFLLYENALKITFSSIEHSNEIEVEEKGIATGFLLNQQELSASLVNEYISRDKISNIDFINPEELDFEFISSNTDNNEIVFNISGRGHFVWRINVKSLIEDLIVSKAENYESVFKKYPDIETAEIIFKPSWWHNIPQSPNRIHFKHVIKGE